MVRGAWLALLLCCVVASSVEAQVSPGKLAKQHEALEGLKNCLKCHELGSGPSAKKCLECHREIAVRLDDKRGYHDLVVTQQDRACFECHSDHAGRGFDLVYWPQGRDRFDHPETGYVLEGKHKSVKCRDCHKAALVVEDLKALQKDLDLNRTFLGLDEACLACHVDEHRDQLPNDCLKCHDQHAWKPAPLFDHGRTKFALTGKHTAVACVKCHPALPGKSKKESYVKYAGVRHNSCLSCHEDIHKGKFGSECESCHQTSGWRDLVAGRFDHSKTKFPLLGRHASVACAKCHEGGSKFQAREFDKCSRCHEDVHRGQFAGRKDKGLCEGCHNVDGFVPALFTVDDHQTTRFRLDGAHLAQPCIACHKEVTQAGKRYRQFVQEDRRCEACHDDVHAGQFAGSKPAKGCDTCHGTSQWRDLSFDHDRDTSYRLEGQHRTVACGACHMQVSEGGRTFVRYKPIDPSCKTCHSKEGLELKTN